MNRIFSVVWNTSLACWVVASEHACKESKGGRTALRLLCRRGAPKLMMSMALRDGLK